MKDKINPAATPPLLSAAARRLRTALALFESGVAMKRAQLSREDRDASAEEIARRITHWLRTRPGAPCGDAEGIGRIFAGAS